MNKEYLYVGHYYDSEGRYILKIGTTNDLSRRLRQHNRKYKLCETNSLLSTDSFVYDWYTQLTRENTLKYESLNKELWKEVGYGHYIPNDRFIFEKKPLLCEIKIRKTYTIFL